MNDESDKWMGGGAFADAVLQMAHVAASSAALEALRTYGRTSPPHLALLAFAGLAASLRDNDREAAERALARFFKARD